MKFFFHFSHSSKAKNIQIDLSCTNKTKALLCVSGYKVEFNISYARETEKDKILVFVILNAKKGPKCLKKFRVAKN